MGDLATNQGIVELRVTGSDPLNRLLDAGEADGDLLAEILDSANTPDYVADMLRRAEPPVTLTDGLV